MFAMSLPEDDFQVEELRNLLEHALQNTYKSRENDPKGGSIMFNCLRLFGKDYQYSVVSNTNGELCNHYPSKVVVLEYVLAQCDDSSKHRVQSLYNVDELKELFSKARFARCRARFSIPVILFEGKHICRSATISGGAEIYGRSGIDFFFTGGESIPGGSTNNDESSEWQLFNRIRGQDIRLLKQFSVGMICDLMVEKKKVKFGMNVTSSEKVDKENRYAEFSIMSVPYPGCEFFREWRQNGYMAEGMMFDWEQGYVDADLDLPDQMNSLSSIDWTKYRTWDLVKLTQNYLRLLLHYVKKGDSGLLIHCISGWDRTPLFISLLRLSLWADGSIHTSLSPLEILYLTIAYDWFLFGHNLPDRIGKGEEIFFFCFNFLKYITSEEFSVTPSAKAKTVSRTNSECNMADDVLLGTHIHQAASSTSINSSSSANSTKSSIDNPPTCFSTDMPDDEPITPHGPPVSIPSCTSRLAPVTKVQTDKCASSPMAVPCNRWREPKPNSPAYGSWQIISGTGSFRGSTSSYDSPRSSASEHSFAGHGCYTQHEPHEETPRKQRLDAVRRLFLSVYCSGTGCRTFPEANGANSGISGLLENFAEKVGFRGSGSTIV